MEETKAEIRLQEFLKKLYIMEEQVPRLKMCKVYIDSKRVWMDDGVSIDISTGDTKCIAALISHMSDDKDSVKASEILKASAKYVGTAMASIGLALLIPSTFVAISPWIITSVFSGKSQKPTASFDHLRKYSQGCHDIVDEALKKKMRGFFLADIIVPGKRSDYLEMYAFQLDGIDWEADKYLFLKRAVCFFLLYISLEALMPEASLSVWNLVQNEEIIILNTARQIVREICNIEINDLIRMSSMTYEGKSLDSDMLIGENADEYTGIILKEKISFEADHLRQIVKLMQIGKSGYNVWLDVTGGNSEESDSAVTALIQTDDKQLINGAGYRGRITFFNGKGWLLSSRSGGALLEYINGRFYIPDDNSDLNKKAQVLKAYFSSSSYTYLENMLEFVKNLNHGTMVILTTEEEAEKEANRLTESGRGYRINQKFDKKTRKLFEGLTYIDGALIFDTEGCCYAFGVIVDGESGIAYSGDAKLKQGNPARGSRYNSAKNYVVWKQNGGADKDTVLCLGNGENLVQKKYAALVKSDDGSLDLIGIEDGMALDDKTSQGNAAEADSQRHL